MVDQQRRLQDVAPATGSDDRPSLRPIVVALGDASFSHASRYQPATPNTRVKRMLEDRYCVVSVDENNTSKLCCHCHRDLLNMKGVRRCRDGVQREVTLRGIRLCKTGESLITLNRDYSAATNIMAIFRHSVTHGGERLAPFVKKKRTTTTAATTTTTTMTSSGSSSGSSGPSSAGPSSSV